MAGAQEYCGWTGPLPWRGVGPAGAVPPASPTTCTAPDGPFVRGGAVQPGRGGDGSQDPRAQGYITALCTERAPSRKPRSRASRGSATGSCARVPADQSAPLRIRHCLIGATLYAQGSGSGGTRRAACHHGLALGAAVRAGCVPGATSTGRPAPGDQREATVGAAPGRPAMRRDGGRASDRGRSSFAMAAPSVKPGARRRGRREARRRSWPWVRAACRTRGLARKPGRRPSGRDAC